MLSSELVNSALNKLWSIRAANSYPVYCLLHGLDDAEDRFPAEARAYFSWPKRPFWPCGPRNIQRVPGSLPRVQGGRSVKLTTYHCLELIYAFAVWTGTVLLLNLISGYDYYCCSNCTSPYFDYWRLVVHGCKAFVITWELEVAVSLREVFCLTVTMEMTCFVLRNSEGSIARWLVWGGI
jgi:hypothetical protein